MPTGRLKLRQFDDGTPSELIFYQRDDRDGPKVVLLHAQPGDESRSDARAARQALTTRGIVSKERHVYLVGRTRIHLDRVDGLGDFIELEVLLAQDDDEAGGEQEAHAMFARLGVARSGSGAGGLRRSAGRSRPRLRRRCAPRDDRAAADRCA